MSNIVFMGMGEPLANFGPMWAAVHRLHDDLGIGARHLTVSTVGLVPGIKRLTAADLPVNLAVSLHAANDDLRSRLVPINRRYPLDQLITACEDYTTVTRRRVSFEWALIADVNDRFSDAEELAEIARPLRAHVNLIPLNATPGYPTQGSSRNRVMRFRDALEAAGVNATVRDTRGSDIDAACGQLRAGHEAKVVVGDPADDAQRTRTVRRSVRIASTRRSCASTRAPDHTTQRSTEPSTTAPSATTDRPPDVIMLAAR